MAYFTIAVLSSLTTLLIVLGVQFIIFKKNGGSVQKIHKYYFYIAKNKTFVDEDRYTSIKTEEMIKRVLKLFNEAKVDLNTITFEYKELWDRLEVKAYVTYEQLLALRILLNSDSYFYLAKSDKSNY